jgi:hypothetical protein
MTSLDCITDPLPTDWLFLMDDTDVHRWQLIDETGRRDFLVNRRTGSVTSPTHSGCGDWPAFTQLALDADLDTVAGAVDPVAQEFERECQPLRSATPEQAHTLQLATSSGLTLLAEPSIDFEERFVTAASSEALVERLEVDGVHFGFDPSSDTLHLTRFSSGYPDFTWCDSLRPGPSFALIFHEDGRCTEEDPRSFAKRHLDLRSDTDVLDRHAFVYRVLESLGLETVDPDLEGIATKRHFAIGERPLRRDTH